MKKKSEPSALGDLIQSFLKEKMPVKLNEEIRVFGAWPKAVGPEIQRQAELKSFRQGILFIETRHPIWTVELQSKSHLIKRKINELLGCELVKEIHFRQARG